MLSNLCSLRRCYLTARYYALFFNCQRISLSLSNTFHNLSSLYSCSLPLLTFSCDSRHYLAALSALSFVGALGACGGRQLLSVDATCGLAIFSPIMRSSRDWFLVLFSLSALPVELRLPSSTDCLFRSLAPSPRVGFTFSRMILSQRVSRAYSEVKEQLGIGREGDGASRRALRQKEKSFFEAECDWDTECEAETGRLDLEPERGCGWTVHFRGSISSQLERILRAFWTALSCDIITTIINIPHRTHISKEMGGTMNDSSVGGWKGVSEDDGVLEMCNDDGVFEMCNDDGVFEMCNDDGVGLEGLQLVMQQQYRMYPKRFAVVGLFAVAQMMTAILVNTFTPIAAYLSEIYSESPVVVNMAGLLFVLMHPLFTFPAAYFIDTYGTRVGIAIGSVLCILGISLRMLINYGFWWAIVGQVIAGIGRPFILNCQAKISSNWFTSETRGGITQLLTLILNVSLVLGIFVPAIVFGDYKPDRNDPASIQQGEDLALKVMIVQAVMGYCCYLLNIFFQEALPPTPPSASTGAPREPFKSAIEKMLSNRDYLFLLLSFGCYFGIFNGLSVVLSFLIQPWFGGDDLPVAVGAVGGFPIITGIIGVVVLGPMQRKSGVFKKWVLICMAGSISAMVIFYPLLETGSLFLASFASGYNSFFLIPLVPIMLEFGCELAFPVGEGTAAGMLFATGNLFGFFLGLLLSLIVEGQSKAQTAGGLAFCFGVFVIGIILAYFMKERLNRKNFQKDSDRRKSQLSQGSQLESSTDKEQELTKALVEGQVKKPLEENLL